MAPITSNLPPSEKATGPVVILIAGTTARRFHTLFELLYILIYSGKKVSAFSASFSPEEIKAIDNSLYRPGLFFPCTSAHINQILKQNTQENNQGFILIESHLSDIRTLPQIASSIETIVVTDVAFPDRDMMADVEVQILSATKKYSIQNILYNNDIYRPKTMKEEWAYIPVDHIPVRSHYAYGTHEGNDFFTRREGEKNILYMPNQRIELPEEKAASFAYIEGTIGAYATALLHQIPLSMDALTKLQRVPLFEEYRTRQELFAWMKEYWYPEDMRSMLLAFPRVVIGANIYTRFQPIIESMIEEMERIIVVPETSEEEELLGEYFLQKERDSYFTILYNPHTEMSRLISQGLWSKGDWGVLFDRPESFVSYMKQDL